MHSEVIKVLLVEDDEDDYIIARDLFAEIRGNQFTLKWVKTFQAGLDMMLLNQHDVCLVDYRLGAQNGVDLLRAALERGCQAPIILLTGTGEHQIDVEAMRAGAADYLIKGQLRSDSLERSIRYALQRRCATSLAAFEQARLAAFGAEIGLALARRDSLDALLSRCTAAMAQYLNAALAQIWTFDPDPKAFELRASAGPISERTPPNELPEVRLDPARFAEGKPVLIKQLGGGEILVDAGWLKREGIGSFAAYPLVLEDKLVGLMSVFTQQPLTEQILGEMGSVANGIASCIERKRGEEALDRSEGKYRSVVESIKEVIFQLDVFGNWVFVNPAWTAVTGFEVKPTLGTFFLEYVHQEDQAYSRHIFLKLVERALEYCRYETRLLTHGGKVRWVEVYAQVTLDKQGTVEGLSGTLTDITDRKLAEGQIQKLAAFPQLSPNPVLEFAPDGALTYANDAAQEIVKSLGKQDLFAILPPHPEALVRECLATGQRKLGLAVSTNDRILNWSFFPIAASQVVHCYGADVTEVQTLEAQLRHAQKLESVGQLAAGIAHDFNNILTVIQGYSELLLARCSDPAADGPLKQINLSAQRAAALTRQLLMFSRKQLIQTKVLEMNAVLQNLGKMLQRLLGEDIALDAQYAPEPQHVKADVGMLEQVVMNLAVNSRDAMPKGGKLFIGTAPVEIDAAYVAKHADARAGHFVCLTVTDSGCGMDRKTLDRIFEPFFTTKDVGKGTGLGLATVYGIVKQHKGWVEVASQVRVGTTFKVYFPAAPPPTAQAASDTPAASEPVRGGKETILVVEDEPVLREFLTDFLKSQPYRVLEAGSGAEALRVWDECDGAIDLLLTDMVMPDGMSGGELAAQLKKRNPGLKVIYSSGYSPETLGRDFSQGENIFLSKPYHPPQLARTVRQCLDDNGQRPLEPVTA
jgi:two-component system, cell cycle sensor histidine kinase and response regulator CckA